MRPKRYIVWSTKELNLDDPFQGNWYIRQVLTHGRAEDVAALDWDELEESLPQLDLPEEIAALRSTSMFASKGIITPLQGETIRSFKELPDAEWFYLAGTALSSIPRGG